MTLNDFSKPIRISKSEALKFIQKSPYLDIKTSLYLTGYKLKDGNRELTIGNLQVDPFARDKQPDENSYDPFTPQLQGLSLLLEHLNKTTINGVPREIISMYKTSRPVNVVYFLVWWGCYLSYTSELMKLYSIEEWYVILLEDALTLQAALGGTYKTNEYYKGCFMRRF